MRKLMRVSLIALTPFFCTISCKKKDSKQEPAQEPEPLCEGDTILSRLQLVFSAGQPVSLNPQVAVHLFAQIPNRSDGPDFTFVNKDVTLSELPYSMEWEELPELAVGQPLISDEWKAEVKSGAWVVQKEVVRSDCKQLTWTIDLVEAVP
jgi:hypothetical protein